MTWWDAAFLTAAGVAGGLTGSIAGLASVATYPALLLVGLPPVTANVTNTVALVFNGIGSVWGSRPELKGQGPWLERILPAAAVGGAVGAALLLSTPADGFEKIVPILLGLASVTIVLPLGGNKEARVASHHRHTAAAVCLVGSRLGPVVVRHAPAGPLRVLIGVAGLALAVKLGIDAYR